MLGEILILLPRLDYHICLSAVCECHSCYAGNTGDSDISHSSSRHNKMHVDMLTVEGVYTGYASMLSHGQLVMV